MLGNELTGFSVEDVGIGSDGRVTFENPYLAARLEAAKRAQRETTKPVPNTNCGGCNTVAGCGPSNSSCAPINTVANCGGKLIER